MSGSCKVIRTQLITRTTINMRTGKSYGDEQTHWVTRPCGTPLFGNDTDTCRSCARGWNHPNNYRADGPRPTEVPS